MRKRRGFQLKRKTNQDVSLLVSRIAGVGVLFGGLMDTRVILFLGVMAFVGCAPVLIHNKKFYDHDEAAGYQIKLIQNNLAMVKKLFYHGGSLLVKVPTDYEYFNPPWIVNLGPGPIKESQHVFFLNYYKRDDWLIRESLRKSEMFDSVFFTSGGDYLSYAKDHGFAYVMEKQLSGFVFYDLISNDKQFINYHSGAANLTELLDFFIKNQKSKRGVASYAPAPSPQLKTEFKYDDKTKRGFVSSRINGTSERAALMREIAQICATKNIKLSTGMEAPSGYFRVLDEQLKDGVLTITFESLY